MARLFLTAKGLTGGSQYTVNAEREGSVYGFTVNAQFDAELKAPASATGGALVPCALPSVEPKIENLSRGRAVVGTGFKKKKRSAPRPERQMGTLRFLLALSVVVGHAYQGQMFGQQVLFAITAVQGFYIVSAS